MRPTDEQIVEAVKDARRFEHEGHGAHTEIVAGNLGVSRATAYRWLSKAEERGVVLSQIQHGWRYSKAVRSRRWFVA
jgi:transposase